MKYIYFQRIRLLKNKIAAELRVNFIFVDKKSLLFYESTMCTLSDAYNSMRILQLSDTHNQHVRLTELPEADVCCRFRLFAL